MREVYIVLYSLTVNYFTEWEEIAERYFQVYNQGSGRYTQVEKWEEDDSYTFTLPRGCNACGLGIKLWESVLSMVE
jgi:hypothetical protein